jgi:hypothetical protein
MPSNEEPTEENPLQSIPQCIQICNLTPTPKKRAFVHSQQSVQEKQHYADDDEITKKSKGENPLQSIPQHIQVCNLTPMPKKET